MDERNMHGKIFKQIREERGIKLKDAAGTAISARTLIRFEADETSVSLEVFEQLLRNIGICYQDYFSEYLPLVEIDQSGFLEEARRLEALGTFTAIKSLAIKTLQNENISMATRLYIEQCLSIIGETDGPQIIRDNRKIVLEHLRSIDKYTVNELFALTFILRSIKEDEFSVEFVRRIIHENFKPYQTDNLFSTDKGERSLLLLNSAIALLSRSGYVEEAEEYCLKAIELLKEHYNNVTHFMFHLLTFNYILAQIQLKLNKPEGIELANKCIRHIDAQIELTNLLGDSLTRDRLVKMFYDRNKTGIDFEF
ncbi:helix-turn-helix transcriptional regulator [uncultured Gemella sp.]|uniref:helix-turn-helix domain-containing protein n=1 Tax=uncultured Gemella sp. TaxID=254352 RepID=UPI0025D7B5DE|nr:helix-turn-helix transcriptional regulator [uncultured Gemella sp.]